MMEIGEMRPILITALCCASFTANAAPVYLECEHPDTKGATSYKITLNEEAQTVVYQIVNNGNSFTRPAQFSQTEVVFKTTVASQPILIELQYRIDRTNLKFTRTLTGIGEPGTATGLCTIAQPVKRQF